MYMLGFVDYKIVILLDFLFNSSLDVLLKIISYLITTQDVKNNMSRYTTYSNVRDYHSCHLQTCICLVS